MSNTILFGHGAPESKEETLELRPLISQMVQAHLRGDKEEEEKIFKQIEHGVHP